MRWIIWLPALVIAGCTPDAVRQVDSPFYRLPLGSEIAVLKPIPLRARKARAFLQFGEVVKLGNLDQYYPSCNFEVRQLGEETGFIQPGGMRITGFSEGYDQLVLSDPPQTTRPQVALKFFDSHSMSVNRYVHYTVAAPEQPNLLRFSCRGGEADLPEALPPTLSEIRQAVGDWVEIRPAR